MSGRAWGFKIHLVFSASGAGSMSAGGGSIVEDEMSPSCQRKWRSMCADRAGLRLVGPHRREQERTQWDPHV